MIQYPNAKINIGLKVCSKRSDGYHDLASCFYPINWSDILEINISDNHTTTFTSSGIIIPGDSSNNICLKAYNLLKKDFNISPINIHLHKIIPIGAGLGGGSADGAYTLVILNELFKLNLSKEILINYAKQLGSDCAFFISNTPTWATEKGDKFETINLSLKGLYIYLIYPHLHISTAEAYSGVYISGEDNNQMKNTIENTPLDSWKEDVYNDFEKHLSEEHPVISELKNAFKKHKAVYTAMTGSGSTVFGLFNEKPRIINDLNDSYTHHICQLD